MTWKRQTLNKTRKLRLCSNLRAELYERADSVFNIVHVGRVLSEINENFCVGKVNINHYVTHLGLNTVRLHVLYIPWRKYRMLIY